MTNRDKSYCINEECPFTDCNRHRSQITEPGIYSFADFDATYKKYITWLATKLIKGGVNNEAD